LRLAERLLGDGIEECYLFKVFPFRTHGDGWAACGC
jgi:hypothetical protein